MALVPRTPKTVRKLECKSRQPVADYRVFRVERLVYESPRSPQSPPRDVFVFACPDWCNVIAETKDGQILLVWQYRFGTDALSLELPAGVVDPGESPETAALRELREETGYEATSLELLCVLEPNPALQNNRCFTFLARDVSPTGRTEFDELEDLEVLLVARGDLPGLLDSGQIAHALMVSPIETYLRRFCGSNTRA